MPGLIYFGGMGQTGYTGTIVGTGERASVSYAGLSFGGDIGQYDPGITAAVDKEIRHMPIVLAHMIAKANQLLSATASRNFRIIVQADSQTQRPRAYVVPANSKGIHEELKNAVLLKAALGMAGK